MDDYIKLYEAAELITEFGKGFSYNWHQLAGQRGVFSKKVQIFQKQGSSAPWVGEIVMEVLQ